MNHQDQLVALKRIEGQIRGLQKMIEEGRYCIDILTQIQSTTGALARVEGKILEKHLSGCVKTSLAGKSEADKNQKIAEIMELLKRFRRTA